jgi:hypothetical protein
MVHKLAYLVNDVYLILSLQGGKVSTGGIRKALSMFYHVRKSVSLELTTMADTMHQMANDINKMRRSLSIDDPIVSKQRLHELQGTSCRRTPKIGSALQIRRKTTISDAKFIEMEPLNGFSKVASSLSGTRRAPFCGSMENVCSQ